MNYKQVIIVEGLHDEQKLKSIFKDINIITTNGMEISDKTLDLIKKISEKYEIILFLDPDGPGEKIRLKIMNTIPNCKHAFIKKDKCISKNHKKVGIEHATKEDIISSLNNLLEITDNKSDITFEFLFNINLIGSKNSSLIRQKICEHFNIGQPNAKTFLKRLNLFGITKKDINLFLNKQSFFGYNNIEEKK